MRSPHSESWRRLALFALLAIVCGLSPAHSQQPAALVIEGGTLIDGNGGTPTRDSVVVIEGNKITKVSRKGQVSYPANAWIIKADGKYVLPGLFDSQNSYSWYFGEGMLNHGITSTIDVGTTGETAVPYRDAVFHGKARGPRAVDLRKASRGGEGGPQRGAEEGAIPDPPFSPQPAIETMNPIIVTQGDSAAVTLTGFNFVRKSVVYLNGRPVPFRAVSSTELQVTLSAEALREAGRFELVVKNPEPLDPFYVKGMWGNGTSNVAHLIVNYKY